VSVPDAALLGWVVAEVGAAGVAKVTGLRNSGSPWLVELNANSGSELEVVLRTVPSADRSLAMTEVAALHHLASSGLPLPRILAVDLEGTIHPGIIAIVMTRLHGTSRTAQPPPLSRFRALGRTAAVLHRAAVPSSSGHMPHRDRPIATVDFATIRRNDRTPSILKAAEQAVDSHLVPVEQHVLVHGDLWQGNTLWNDDNLTGIVDWDCAGIGHPGVDVGSLRCDAAVSVGPDAAEAILDGYRSAGGEPGNVAYWDLVAGLATPPTMDWFATAMHDQGRTDLDTSTLVTRRDHFLQAALEALT
jgi:aminoglycoside phosphotransferase (APT) family kinase protein